MPTTISGSTGVTFPAGGVANTAGAGVGTTDTQTLTNKTLGSGLVAGASLITSGTAVTCAGQTSIDFTGIPSWVKRVTVMFNGVSTSGTSAFLLQLGDAGGIEITGYTSVAIRGGGASNAFATSVIGFLLTESNVAANTYQSLAILSLVDVSTNTWVMTGTTGAGAANTLSLTSGGKSLSATLTQIRVTTVNGTDTFDTTPSAGIINILYE